MRLTRERAKELLPIIKAYAEGKTIQMFDDENEWNDLNKPTFDGDPSSYRIKPEPKCRPFRTQEECWEEMHKHPDFGWVIRSGVYLNISGVYCDTIYTLEDSNGIHFDYAFLELTFTDGAPFGVKEE